MRYPAGMIRWFSGLWRREIGSLQLWEVLRRAGLRSAANRNPQALVQAVERCATCGRSVACSHLLAAGQDDKLADLCPNMMYVGHLRAMERHAPKQDLL